MRKNGSEEIPAEIIMEYFPKLTKDNQTTDPSSPTNLKRINKKISITSYTIVKLLKIKDKKVKHKPMKL